MPCPLAALQLENTAQTASYTVAPESLKTGGGAAVHVWIFGCMNDILAVET